MEEYQVLMHINALQKSLHPELPAPDMLHVPAVQPVDGVHHAGDDRRIFLPQLRDTDRTAPFLSPFVRVYPLVHIDIERGRLLLINHIERKERTVACNNREIRLPRKLFYRRFYTYHILHPVGFARDDVVASQVHIAHFGRKKDMHRLAESDLNFIRSDMLARRQNPDGICRSFFLCEAGG